MVTVDTIARVRRAYFVQGKDQGDCAGSAAGAEHGAVIVRAEAETERRYVRKEQPLPQLGPFVAALQAMVAANATRPKRERLTYQRMFEELRLKGYRGGYDNVRRYARAGPNRKASERRRLTFP